MPDSQELTDSFLVKYLYDKLDDLGFKGKKWGELKAKLKTIIELPVFGEEFSLFRYDFQASPNGESNVPSLGDLWTDALGSAIETLTWYDRRANPSRKENIQLSLPTIADLAHYYHKSARFESILYGADPWYRDHYAHALRVWMLGIYLFVDRLGCNFSQQDACQVEEACKLHPENSQPLFDTGEIIAAYTVAALTHDMGYPLEKVARLNDELASILQSFGAVEWVPLSVTLSQQQHESAQHLLRFLAAKPSFRCPGPLQTEHPKSSVGKVMAKVLQGYSTCTTWSDIERAGRDSEEGVSVLLRCQSKYHNKYSGALEKRQHGCLSALLLHRKLIYFMEGEFALEEDYQFNLEEARQFLIRREILRAISSHTCSEIYFLVTNNLEALLYYSDEMQDWGRPFFSTLYQGDNSLGDSKVKLLDYTKELISWELNLMRGMDLSTAASRLLRCGYDLYQRVRTAPEAQERTYKLEHKTTWTWKSISYSATITAEKPGPGVDTPYSYIITLEGDEPSDPIDIFPIIEAVASGRNLDWARNKVLGKLEKLCSPEN